MKFPTLTVWLCLLSAVFVTGCETFESQGPTGKFVQTVDVAALKTFSYKHTLLSGMAKNVNSRAMVYEELSPQVLTAGLVERGFDSVATGGDFYVVTKWRQETNLNAAEVVRYSLIVELYETATNKVFWRSEQPYAFNAIQYSEQRITQTLQQGIQGFPSRGQ